MSMLYFLHLCIGVDLQYKQEIASFIWFSESMQFSKDAQQLNRGGQKGEFSRGYG